MIGRIVELTLARGFGFILPDGCTHRFEDAHFFSHYACQTGLFSTLRVGQLVEFESTTSDRGNGLRAQNIRPANLTH
jgi:cold shock CspA family protein